MKHTKSEERQSVHPFFKLTYFVGVLFIALTSVMFASCSKDEDDELTKESGLPGTWVYEELLEEDNGTASVKMTLTFNANNTGSIVEDWTNESRASSHQTYSMDFSWSTTTDSSGNDILRISYVSGDKNTELFGGTSSTVLWTRQYVLTGNILNIYQGAGVWVFNRK